MLQTLKQSCFHEEYVHYVRGDSANPYLELCHLRKTLAIPKDDETDVKDQLQTLQNIAHCENLNVMYLEEDAIHVQMRNQLP